MTRKEIIDKLDNVEREVKEIREYLSLSEAGAGVPVGFPLAVKSDFELGYTLEDLYREFGNKVSLARRLKTALQKTEHQYIGGISATHSWRTVGFGRCWLRHFASN